MAILLTAAFNTRKGKPTNRRIATPKKKNFSGVSMKNALKKEIGNTFWILLPRMINPETIEIRAASQRYCAKRRRDEDR